MIYFYGSNDIIHGKFIFLGKMFKCIVMEKSCCFWEIPYETKPQHGREAMADFTVMMMLQWTCCENFWANIVSAAFIAHLMHKTGSKCFQATSEWKPSLMNKIFRSVEIVKKCAAGFTGNCRTRFPKYFH